VADSGTYTDTLVNAMASAVATLCNSGYIRIYDKLQPATADDAITDQILLAELRFAATAFPAPVAGVLTANAIVADSAANASGNAAWCRILKSDGTTKLFDGSVGLIDDAPNLILNSIALVVGQPVSVSSLVFVVPKGF